MPSICAVQASSKAEAVPTLIPSKVAFFSTPSTSQDSERMPTSASMVRQPASSLSVISMGSLLIVTLSVRAPTIAVPARLILSFLPEIAIVSPFQMRQNIHCYVVIHKTRYWTTKCFVFPSGSPINSDVINSVVMCVAPLIESACRLNLSSTASPI